MNSRSSLCCAAVSPGKPEMNVVRIAMLGMRLRSLESSVSMSLREVLRRMLLSTSSLMCCSGMSMYLTTLGRAAMASIISSVKQEG